MAKKTITNPNADLPPLMVLSSFLNEKKREYVSNKLKDFGLVRKEYFNRKLGHQKKDFPLKKFLGKRYRYVTAAMSDAEVEQLFGIVKTLLEITPKPRQNQDAFTSQDSSRKKQESNEEKASFSFLSFILNLLALVNLGVGGYSLYQLYNVTMTLNLSPIDFTIAIAEGVILYLVPAIILFALAQIIRKIKNRQ